MHSGVKKKEEDLLASVRTPLFATETMRANFARARGQGVRAWESSVSRFLQATLRGNTTAYVILPNLRVDYVWDYVRENG